MAIGLLVQLETNELAVMTACNLEFFVRAFLDDLPIFQTYDLFAVLYTTYSVCYNH